jgi:hypothetical protein
MTPDPIPAALDQLAAHHDQLTRLDTREADHHATISGRLAELTDLVTAIGHALQDDTAALAKLDALDQQVADLTAQLTQTPDTLQPDPVPAWWNLPAAGRRDPVAGLQAWVDQVYRPGYGHLAATLAPCWPAHDLCLYTLDLLCQLWRVLYLPPGRTTALLSAQAEYQARILPALAAQLTTETTRCGHTRHHTPAPGHPRPTP